jgi:hypothetical protein
VQVVERAFQARDGEGQIGNAGSILQGTSENYFSELG